MRTNAQTMDGATYTLASIVHENGRFFVVRKRGQSGWFDVLRNEGTHAIHRSTFHYSNDPRKALSAAIDDCNRRASGEHWAGSKSLKRSSGPVLRCRPA